MSLPVFLRSQETGRTCLWESLVQGLDGRIVNEAMVLLCSRDTGYHDMGGGEESDGC